MSLNVTKVVGFATAGAEAPGLNCTKVVGFAVLEAGSPPSAVTPDGASTLTFSLTADILPQGVAGFATLTFAVPVVTTGVGGFTGPGTIAPQAQVALTFLTQGALVNPSSFPLELGLSSGGCPQVRVAHHPCEDRFADWPELRPERLASYQCEDRLASYYKEED